MDKIKVFLKENKLAYKIYWIIGKAFTKILNFVIPVDEKKILFISYGGKKVDDSPLCIYKKMLQDNYFDDYKFIWAVTKETPTNNLESKRTKIVSADNIRYFLHLFNSKIWITNTTVFRGLPLTIANKHLYINTWHGTPLKKIGVDSLGKDTMTNAIKNTRDHDKNCIYLAQSSYEKDIYKRVFKHNLKEVVLTGLPRNDVLFELSHKNINKEYLQSKIGINTKREIIIYAPTFRDYSDFKYIDEKMNLIRSLSEKYYILYRGHHASSDKQIFDELELDYFKNVSDYPVLNDLLLISDVLITDYSSICIDFSILDKPVYFFTYDLLEYEKHRGLYIDYRDFFEKVHLSPQNLSKEILRDSSLSNGYQNTKIIKGRFLEKVGKGTKNAVELVKKRNES